MFTAKGVSKKKNILILSLIILSMFFFSTSLNLDKAVVGYNITEFRISLVLKTNGGGTRPDICLYIASYLSEIGIDVEVKVEEWTIFIGTLLLIRDFDLAFVGLAGGGASPDMRDIYTEDGSLNIFGLDQDIPYCQLSEEMQNEGVTITNLDERQQHYYNFQQLMMDKIVPMLPFYSPRNYVSTWSNTEGYQARWGITESLPYMNYNGLHEGQISLNELNLADSNWRDLNPLFSDRSASSFIWGLLAEPVVQISPDFAPLKTGLVHDWEQIDEFHYKFYMRDNLFWNPSYDIRDRTASSDPLSTIPSGELLTGLKYGEYSDGTNQQVKAKDAVFTYLVWANSDVSESTRYHSWISNIYVDPFDDLAFHVHIDGDPNTPQAEHYSDFWMKLPWDILPEFYLNSSSSTITYTTGGVKCRGLYSGIESTPEWIAFSESAFGCGKFMLDYSILNSVTVLERSPYWFGVGALDGITGKEPFVKNVNVRVIPDISAALAEFKAGKLDWASITLFSSERKQMQADPKYNVQSLLTGSMSILAFNLDRSLIGGSSNYDFLVDQGKEEYTRAVALRKAICYAIDRDEINQVLYDGECTICHSPLYPITAFYYYNDIIKYNYDLEAAKEWFDLALAIPKLQLTVENHAKVGRNIIFKADYTSGPDVTSSTLYYYVVGGYSDTVPMIKKKQNYYTYNIGSEFEKDMVIQFRIYVTNAYGESFCTRVISFTVGTKNELLFASYPFISLLAILVIPVIFIARRRKNKK